MRGPIALCLLDIVLILCALGYAWIEIRRLDDEDAWKGEDEIERRRRR